MTKAKTRHEACYRLRLEQRHPLHGQMLALLVSSLVRPDGGREAADAGIPPGCADAFEMLAKLPPEQLHAVARLLDDVVEIRLPPAALAAAVHEVAGSQERRQLCLQRGEWLIRHGGSNRMILLLCPALCADDVRQLRRRLGIPVNKGRLPALPLEVRLSVAADWQATAGETDTFLRYRALAERHPGCTLGQLYSTVAAVEGGCL